METKDICEWFDRCYHNGYYSYFVLITFKDGTDYTDSHPKKAIKEFERVFTRYMNRKKIDYEMYPELSQEGRLHIHGVVMFKANKKIPADGQYVDHEKKLRLVRNWCRRKFGINNFQRIYSFITTYGTSDIRYHNREMQTSFIKGYSYITKDKDLYQFLGCIKNTNMALGLPNKKREDRTVREPEEEPPQAPQAPRRRRLRGESECDPRV